MAIYKDVEFKEFIKEIEEGSITHWQEIAEALGVDADTVTRWKNTPEAIEARRKGIAKTLADMSRVGAKDWRMHLEKLKMLGINPPQKIEGSMRVSPAREILEAAGLLEGDNDGQTDSDTQRASDNQT